MSVPESAIPQLPAGRVAQAGALVGAAVSLAPQGHAAALKKNPNHAFFLRHSGNWEVGVVTVGTGKAAKQVSVILPSLNRFVLRPGANGVRTIDRNEQPDAAYREAVQRETLAGHVFLDPSELLDADHMPAGASAGGYLRKYDCVQPMTGAPGVYFEEVWNVPLAGAPSRPHEWKFDAGSYNRWRAFLVASKRIAEPTAGVMAQLERKYRTRIERIEVLNIPEDVRAKRVRVAEAAHKAAVNARPVLEATP